MVSGDGGEEDRPAASAADTGGVVTVQGESVVQATAIWPPAYQSGAATVPTLASPSSRPLSSSRASDRPYKGFSTPIASMFHRPSQARTDCCAMACCGILQSDMTRYLLTGVEPPSILKRATVHIFIPVGLFIVAGYAAVTIRDVQVNEAVCTVLIVALFVYIVGGCVKGRVKRVRIRREMLWRMHQMDEAATPGAGGGTGGDLDVADPLGQLGQANYEMTCAHRLLGCYNSDVPFADGADGAAAVEAGGDHAAHEEEDLCARMFRVFSNLCCGACCGCYLQVCGVCAMAQEAREMERIIPLARRRIDYVTFEPYVEYYAKILTLRHDKNNHLWDHYKALSHLSMMLVKSLLIVVAALFVLSLIGKTAFNLQNMLVLLATFCQAFLILYFVHWKWNRFDLSLDAVVKYFAAGFILTTGLAIFFEMVESIVLQLLLSVIIALLDIDVVEDEDGYGNDDGYDRLLSEKNEDIMKEFSEKYPGIVVIYLFLNAFAMAAFVEELCKYFGYKMVEHPDFLSEEDLAEASAAPGLHDDDGGSGSESDDQSSNAPNREGSNNAVDLDPSAQHRSVSSLGAGITVSMVAVALGFACCENLIYIFIYNGSSVDMEVAVLLARSLFPVHPLCAAIQSIGVCKRDLENEKSHKLGRIILPAILLHGSFDFSLMLLSFVANLKKGDNNEENEGGATALISFFLSLLIVIGGTVFYLTQSRAQKQRLDNLSDAASYAFGVRSRLI